METYEHLIKKKKRFIVFALIFTVIFYLMLPIALIALPKIMNRPSFVPGLSWVWLYAFVQVVLVWGLGWMYHEKAKKLEQILKQM